MKVSAKYFGLLLTLLLAYSCDNNDDEPTISIDEPSTYNFVRNNQSTVDFNGQTTRIHMAQELIGKLKDFDGSSLSLLLEMYRNQTESGDDANPFSNADLNGSTKSIKSKVAASNDFYSANTTDAAIIKQDFEDWMDGQINVVFPNENTLAEAGIAGQIADGTSTRYINEKGLEYDQMIGKSLIGGLMVDQMLNNYLGTGVLDAADNREANDNETTASGKNYTTMEHKWDEAYGYLYGTSQDLANPNATIGNDDSFLNKYLGRVENDPDFAGIADDIYNAFKKGRAAIVAGAYDLRDEQAAIIREKVSTVIGVRAVYYLEQARFSLEQSNPDMGGVFHDLSEAYGFIYSLQFTRLSDTNAPYFTKSEVDQFLTDLLDDGSNGLWDLQSSTLESIAKSIAGRFDFTVEQAGS